MSHDLRPGSEPIKGYTLIDRLGRGGFGEVWKATGPGGFQVALKFVTLDEKAGPVELRALEVIKHIRHPHLLGTFGSWQEEGRLIIAMELADKTLLDRFREAAGQGFPGIPAPEIFEHFLDAAKALDYLNEPRHPSGGSGGTLGIQHRDVKPQNLLLVGGSVKVADFGLARVLESTQTGHTGSMTPSYAAPEFFDQKTSSQSDQYSLAVTYCHLRGGRLPFEGNAAAVIAGHLMREPDLSMIPEDERPAVAKALSKLPKDRWPSCRAFVQAATSATEPSAAPPSARPRRSAVGPRTTMPATSLDWTDIDTSPPPPAPESPPRRRPIPAIAAGLAVVAGLILWASGAFSRREPRDVGPLAKESPPAPATIRPGSTEQARPAPPTPAGPIPGASTDSTPTPTAPIPTPVDSTPTPTPTASTPAPEPPASTPIVEASASFFDGRSLKGWEGLDGYWKVENGTIIGKCPPGRPAHTFLCSEKTYGNFELRFRARLLDGIGNSGVQFRSRISNRQGFRVVGPQCEIGRPEATHPPSSLVTEPEGKPAISADRDRVKSTYKVDGFNDYVIRCEGKHVTIRLNGMVMVDDDFPSLPEDGIIAWQIHGRQTAKEADFKDITLVELGRSQANDGFRPLFNGKDLTGWKTHPTQSGHWRVEDGKIVGRDATSHLFSERGDFDNFHLRVEARINQSGGSGVYFRSEFGLNRPVGGTVGVYPKAYEAQIYCGSLANAALTGSLFGMADIREQFIKPDTWFTMEVIAEGKHIVIRVDGNQTVDYVDNGRGNSQYTKGHFALQTNLPGTVVEFRKIEVKEIGPSTSTATTPTGGPKESRASVDRGLAMISLANADGAIREFSEAIRLEPGEARAYAGRAYSYANRAYRDQALADANEAIRLDPNLALAYAARGYATALSAKADLSQAIADCDRAIRLEPDSPFGHATRGYVINRRDAAKGQEETKGEAIQDCSEAIRHDQRFVPAYLFRGLSRTFQRQFDLAESDLEHAIFLSPKCALAYALRAINLLGRQEDDRVIAFADRAIRLDQKSFEAFSARGIAYENKGDRKRAQADRDEAKRLLAERGL